MTNFERIGCQRQDDAETIEQAKKAFANSCKICIQQGHFISCESCAIAARHDIRLVALETMAETPDFH